MIKWWIIVGVFISSNVNAILSDEDKKAIESEINNSSNSLNSFTKTLDDEAMRLEEATAKVQDVMNQFYQKLTDNTGLNFES